MTQATAKPVVKTGALTEVRYPLRMLLEEVRTERQGTTLGQEVVDQTEIAKLFSRKPKVRRGKSGK